MKSSTDTSSTATGWVKLMSVDHAASSRTASVFLMSAHRAVTPSAVASRAFTCRATMGSLSTYATRAAG
jgi:hypothetical protein